MNILGIEVGRNGHTQDKINYENKIQKIDNTLTLWKMRNLSKIGKILIIKAHALSNIIYSLSNIQMNANFTDIIQRKLNHFLWGSKVNRVKHSVVIADYDKGGLRMPDIKCTKQSLRLPWIGRILEQNSWNFLPTLHFKPYGGLLFLIKCNFDPKEFKQLPVFYKEMLTYANHVILEPYSNLIIWNNKEIRINNQSIYWDSWKKNGVIFITDVRKLNRWMTIHEFRDKYRIQCNFLQYRGLINALNKYWPKIRETLNIEHYIKLFNEKSKMVNTILNNKIDIAKAKSRDFYKLLIHFDIEPPKATTSWGEKGCKKVHFLKA